MNIFNTDFTISHIVSVTFAESRAGMSYFYSRPHHALIYKVSGVMSCMYGSTRLEFSRNDIVYIPKGMTYRSVAVSDPPGKYIIINFDSVDSPSPDEILVAHFENHANLYSLFSKCADEWLFKDSAHGFSCKSYAYKILALMARALDGSDESARRRIAPSLEYLRLHISDPSLDAAALARASDLSEAQFRRLFKSVFLVAPTRYITSVRVGQARELLDSDGASAQDATLEEIALQLGFTDADGFARAFRREVGMSPGEYRKKR